MVTIPRVSALGGCSLNGQTRECKKSVYYHILTNLLNRDGFSNARGDDDDDGNEFSMNISDSEMESALLEQSGENDVEDQDFGAHGCDKDEFTGFAARGDDNRDGGRSHDNVGRSDDGGRLDDGGRSDDGGCSDDGGRSDDNVGRSDDSGRSDDNIGRSDDDNGHSDDMNDGGGW
jgi:hypothetical protein